MGIVLKKYKVTATKDVGYETSVLAKDEDEALRFANQEDLEWSRVDDGHDWTIENVTEERDKVKSRSEVEKLVTDFVEENKISATYGKDSEGLFVVNFVVDEEEDDDA